MPGHKEHETIESLFDPDSDDLIEQKKVSDLINAGFSLELLMRQSVAPKKIPKSDDPDSEPEINQYFLFVRWKDKVRPIHTQRGEHRSFTKPERALDWGKRLGFSKATLIVDFGDYVLEDK